MEQKNIGKRENNTGKIKVFIALAFIAVIVGIILYSVQTKPQNPYQLKFANETLNFRANLEKAAAVPVFPDEQAIRKAVLSENVSRIKISYVPGEYNPFYAAASFEIAYKLVILFKYYYGTSGYLYEGENKENCLFFEETDKEICISPEPVPSEEGIIASAPEPAIFLSAANETSVRLKDNIIYIRGKDFSEMDRKYTDLDLATDKFLIVLLNYQQ